MDRESFGEYLEMIGEARDFLENNPAVGGKSNLEDVRCRELPLAGLAVVQARHTERGNRYVYNFESDCWEASSQELEDFLARCEGENPHNSGSLFGS